MLFVDKDVLKKTTFLSWWMTLLIAVCSTVLFVDKVNAESEADAAKLRAEGLAIVKQFADTLKPQLKAAMQSGGPSKAVEVCSTQAPLIASQLSLESGWAIKRVSLKPRNTETASADEWEREALEQFNQRQLQGEPAQHMLRDQVFADRYRLMKAQGVEPLCLNCHGSALSPDLKTALDQYYPDDMATGYSLGQIRGAFSLMKTGDF